MKDIKDKKMEKPCLNCDLNPPNMQSGDGIKFHCFSAGWI